MKGEQTREQIRHVKTKCNECERFHSGKCWGKKMEKSPYSLSKKQQVPQVLQILLIIVRNLAIHLMMNAMPTRLEISPSYCTNADNLRNIIESTNRMVYLDSCANAHVFSYEGALSNIHVD